MKSAVFLPNKSWLQGSVTHHGHLIPIERSPLHQHVPFLSLYMFTFILSLYFMSTCLFSEFTLISPAVLSPLNFLFSSSMVLCYQILCIFSVLYFTPACGFMLFWIIDIFSLANSPPSRAPRVSTGPIYHIIHPIYSFSFTHTHHRSCFLPL